MSPESPWKRESVIAEYLTTEYSRHFNSEEIGELSVKSQVPIEFRECPPESETVTAYDRQCFRLYITLIDGDASEAEWPETYRKAFGVEIGENWEGAHRQYLTHLKRAQWMTAVGYPKLLWLST